MEENNILSPLPSRRNLCCSRVSLLRPIPVLIWKHYIWSRAQVLTLQSCELKSQILTLSEVKIWTNYLTSAQWCPVLGVWRHLDQEFKG